MWSEFAPAKINLSLHITGKRPDGYHALQSVVAFASCGDFIRAEHADTTSLDIEGVFADELTNNDENNLVLKALRSVEALIGRSLNLHITLEKNLPVASGIGGGSADAAAILRLLKTKLQDELQDEEFQKIAISLGADVPVCLLNKPSWVSGIGEIIEPLECVPGYSILLMNPRKALATKEVFAAHKAKRMFTSLKPSCENSDEFTTYIKTRQNSLQPAAISIMPEISQMLDAISDTPKCILSRMSGSGATCFGIYETKEQAEIAASELSKSFPTYWVSSAQLLT
jgi:4-diphosphocytidyl-2-C-methyl-D-erythritol kinase